VWVLLPFIQIWNAYIYARAKEGVLAKVGTFATFLPVIVLSAIVWAMSWAFILFIAARLFRS
jgi:hypothetical protein